MDRTGKDPQAAALWVASGIVVMPAQDNVGLHAEEVVRLVAIYQPCMGMMAKHDVDVFGLSIEVVELGFAEKEIRHYVLVVGDERGIQTVKPDWCAVFE